MGRYGVAKEAYTVLSVASVGCYHPFQRIFFKLDILVIMAQNIVAPISLEKRKVWEQKKWK